MAAEKSTEQRVREIIVEQLGVNADQVTPDAKFIEDLGADSLDTVELVMALEEDGSKTGGISGAAPVGEQPGLPRSILWPATGKNAEWW